MMGALHEAKSPPPLHSLGYTPPNMVNMQGGLIIINEYWASIGFDYLVQSIGKSLFLWHYWPKVYFLLMQ